MKRPNFSPMGRRREPRRRPQKAAGAPPAVGAGSEFTRELYAYRCASCGRSTLVEVVDDGTTPLSLRCRAPQEAGVTCAGVSYAVRIHWEAGRAAFRFRKPTAEELRHAKEPFRSHYRAGGLLLERISRA